MKRAFDLVDQILRGRTREVQDTGPTSQATSPGQLLSLRRVVGIVIAFGPVYGLAMGSYAWIVGQRSLANQLPQMFCSGIKMPLLVLFTVFISLPSFFVINTLMGLRDDFGEALRAIVSAQAGLMIILVSFFPMTLFSYICFATIGVSYQIAVLFNAAMFGLASIAAQVLLRSYYQRLIDRDSRHRWMVRIWIFVYAFVGIQAGYVLRPFIGDPDEPTTFFRKESFQNAYVKIFEMVSQVIEAIL